MLMRRLTDPSRAPSAVACGIAGAVGVSPCDFTRSERTAPANARWLRWTGESAGAHGVLYEVSDADCARLDRVEGVHTGGYVRRSVRASDCQRPHGDRHDIRGWGAVRRRIARSVRLVSRPRCCRRDRARSTGELHRRVDAGAGGFRSGRWPRSARAPVAQGLMTRRSSKSGRFPRIRPARAFAQRPTNGASCAKVSSSRSSAVRPPISAASRSVVSSTRTRRPHVRLVRATSAGGIARACRGSPR